MDGVIEELWAVIEDRQERRPEGSYTASLLDGETDDSPLEKLGEESTELLLAAADGDGEEVAAEAADVVYHLLVVLADSDADLDDLRAELERRRR
ncbi:MAG: phosphoribosyl-ATP diphosphatase [Halobacteriaceae archaeon]